MKNLWYYDFPVARMGIAEENGAISGIFFVNFTEMPGFEPEETPLIRDVAGQMGEYFAGRRKIFDFPLILRGTDFQIAVWNALKTIPYGKTATYGEIAARIGRPGAARAAGGANHRNPVAIVIPCHRVIGSGGTLTGYGGGLPAKQFLLDLERRHS